MALTPDQQEEFDALKQWWKENGVTILVTFVLSASALFGWKSWQTYQIEQRQAASVAFEQLSAVPDGTEIEPSLDTAKIDGFIQEHKGSGYAPLAALLAAKAFAEEDEYAQAESQLKWAMEHTDKGQIEEIARLRLGRVLLAQENHDEALLIANASSDTAFASLFAELRGDIYVAQGAFEQAKESYQEAASGGALDLSVLKLKLNEAGGRLN